MKLSNVTKIAVTIPSPGCFGGRDYFGALTLIDSLESLGCQVLPIETNRFRQTPSIDELDTLSETIKKHDPVGVLSLPNAGYGLGCNVKVRGQIKNFFTEILDIPLALLWDDPLGQFSNEILSPLPNTSANSTANALKRIKDRVSHPNILHFSWDTGHISSVTELGTVDRTRIRYHCLPATTAYVNQGERPVSKFERNLIFAGNVYSHALSQCDFGGERLLKDLAAKIADRKLQDMAIPNWHIFSEEILKLEEAERLALKLDPNESFFWMTYQWITWMALNSQVRLGVLGKLANPLDFFGCFNDPRSSHHIDKYTNINFLGTVDYRTELPRVFASSRITVDVANAITQNSLPSKFYECFASGGFMLVDRKKDIIKEFGELAEQISYRTVDELNEKVEYFLSNESERLELALELQNRILKQYRVDQWLTSILKELSNLDRQTKT